MTKEKRARSRATPKANLGDEQRTVVFLRDARKNRRTLLAVNPQIRGAGREIRVEKGRIEIIGWHAGREVVRLKGVHVCS